jgi:branched-chain amino acid transport system ATP-binding protein
VPALLSAEGVWASYGDLRAVLGVTLAVPEGATVALLGPNGAGKSTLLKVLAGLHKAERGRVLFRGRDVTGWPAHRRARAGLLLLPEGRAIFPGLSVADNLRLSGAEGAAAERVLRAFPVLGERRGQTAGTLSGGEQQMLALARAMAVESPMVMLDEPSLALAPRLVDEVFLAIARLRDEGRTILLVEQYVGRALDLADVAYVMRKGRIEFAGEPGELRDDPALSRAYLGTELAGSAAP